MYHIDFACCWQSQLAKNNTLTSDENLEIILQINIYFKV